MNRCMPWSGALSLALAFAAPSFAGEAKVERGDFELTFERHARVEPARRLPVRYEPEVFGGRLELAARARAPGPVAEGDVVVELSARELDEQLEDATALAAEAEKRLAVLREERRIQGEQAALAVDRAEFAAEVAARANELFRDYESGRTVEYQEINLERQQDGLKSQREELAQLEKMYQDTTLASETKDIVLERTRRELARTERASKFWDRDFRNFMEIHHPQQARRTADAARFAQFDLDVARVNARLTGVRVELDLAAAERTARDARRRAERLARDRERLAVKAPTAGYWLPQLREVGAAAQPWQPVGDVADVTTMRLRGTLDPAAFRVIEPQSDGTIVGATVDLRFTARPELVAKARFTEVVTVGETDGDSTAFPFLALIEAPADAGAAPGLAGIMIGFDAIVFGRRTLDDVLFVPAKAVTGAPARPVVKRLGPDGKEEEVVVRVGPTRDGKTVILDGLSEGDRVVTPDA